MTKKISLRFKKKTLFMTLGVGALLAIPAFASNIDLGINGDTQVGSNFINFSTDYPLTPGIYTPPTGLVQITSVSSGNIFATAGIHGGETANLQDLNAATQPVRPAGFTSPYTPGMPFLTFNGSGSNLDLYLTAVLQGNVAPGSPLTISPTNNGVSIELDLDGYVLNTLTGTTEDFIGVFTTPLVGYTEPTLLAALPVTDIPFSGDFELTFVPEPASLLLMGMGLLGAGLVARRTRKPRC